MRLSTAKVQNATAQKETVRWFDGRDLRDERAQLVADGIDQIPAPT